MNRILSAASKVCHVMDEFIVTYQFVVEVLSNFEIEQIN